MESELKMHRSGILLLEVMVSILLISVCSAVCLQVFARAQQTSRQAQLLTQAVNTCASAAEVLRGSESVQSAFRLLGQENAPAEQDRLRLPQQNGCVLEIGLKEKNPVKAQICYLDETGSEIYRLELVKYESEVIS